MSFCLLIHVKNINRCTDFSLHARQFISFTGFSLDSLVAALGDHVTFLEAILRFKLSQLRENVFELVDVKICNEVD
jgi:hypothetical protein